MKFDWQAIGKYYAGTMITGAIFALVMLDKIPADAFYQLGVGILAALGVFAAKGGVK
jgi:hypothetical protein